MQSQKKPTCGITKDSRDYGNYFADMFYEDGSNIGFIVDPTNGIFTLVENGCVLRTGKVKDYNYSILKAMRSTKEKGDKNVRRSGPK